MTTYRVTLADGQQFLLFADLVRAEAPISGKFLHDDDADDDYDRYWQGTPYQTADASHDVWRAAELFAGYYRSGEDDCTEIESVDSVDEMGAARRS